MKLKENILLVGHSLKMNESALFKIYVPTRWGGKLTVKVTKGKITNLKLPNGKKYNNGTEIGIDNHGWYTFKVSGVKNYEVSCTFIQEAEVEDSKKPWNGWFWPWKSTIKPNLCDKGSPLHKYDQFVDEIGTKKSAQNWEIKKHSSPLRKNWEGYCPSWATASHIEPKPKGGDTFSMEDEKCLLTLLYESKNPYKVDDFRKIRGNICSCGEFHHLLEKWILGEGKCLEEIYIMKMVLYGNILYFTIIRSLKLYLMKKLNILK